MATLNKSYTKRELMNRTTITLTVTDPPSDRFLFWIGTNLMRFGARIAGLGYRNVETW